MQNIQPEMRLKVKRDTFIYPESNQGVYLRNNVTSIRMEGSTIEKWLENLIPMLDGSQTLDDITNGLPPSFKDQVFKIAQVLYVNGFLHDLSQDLPHQLPEQILTKYASQIEFISTMRDSDAYRFQMFRQAKVAVMGSGPLLLSLVLSLIQSGMPVFSILPTHSQKVDKRRLQEIIAEARKSDPETKITILDAEEHTWSENLEHADYIIFGSQDSDHSQLPTVQKLCSEQGKHFLPLTIEKDLAFAGPLLSPDSQLSWESAYRRVHQTRNENSGSTTSSTAGALLANVAVFELFKDITGAQERKKDQSIYKLNLETLEGNWHSVLPHPQVAQPEQIQEPLTFLKSTNHQTKDLHSLFYTITSKETGIFHTWEEEELLQLPLSQCKVGVADPRSEGPSRLQPVMVCSGLTHEEARLEAGLAGIENYVKCLYADSPHSMSIGTGQTTAEGLGRALQNGLHEVFLKSTDSDLVVSAELDTQQVQDNHCLFMIKALSTLSPEMKLHWGKDVLGFPVVWVQSKNEWYGSVGLSVKAALRRALQTAVMTAQNKEKNLNRYGVVVSSMTTVTERQQVSLPALKEETPQETLASALHTLKSNHMKAQFYTLQAEPIITDNTSGIFGMTLSEEERS